MVFWLSIFRSNYHLYLRLRNRSHLVCLFLVHIMRQSSSRASFGFRLLSKSFTGSCIFFKSLNEHANVIFQLQLDLNTIFHTRLQGCWTNVLKNYFDSLFSFLYFKVFILNCVESLKYVRAICRNALIGNCNVDRNLSPFIVSCKYAGSCG